MNENMKALIIGVGAAGNKAVLTVQQMNAEIALEDIILVNSTPKDIPADFAGTSIIISPDDSGCGKERTIAKEFTLTAIQSGKFDIAEKVESYDIIIIVTSLEGGTGSGSAPIIAKYCNEVLGKNTHLIGFTGFEEDARGLQNTVEFFQEVGSNIMVQCIQNKSFLKSCGGSKFKAEQAANRELANRIRILDGSLLRASEQNIDSTDIYKVVNTNGYMTIESETIKGSLDDVSNFNKLCEMMIYNSKSLKSSDPGQVRMAVIMNISPVSEDFIDSNFTLLKDAYGYPYECFMHKQYDESQPEYIAFISSGQKMPLDEVKAIYDRYVEESSKVSRSNDKFFDEVAGFKGNKDDNKFNMGRPTQKTTVNKADFMKQFQTKPTKNEKKG
jgi:cell division GTPase FtsZ